jgi:hypothetical protein
LPNWYALHMAKAKARHEEAVAQQPVPELPTKPTGVVVETVTDVIEFSEPTSSVSIEDVLDLQNRLDSMKDAAIKGLLRRIEESKAQLARLGYVEQTPEPGWITTAPRTITPAKRRGVGRGRGSKPKSGRFCKVCNVTGHDRRAHKNHPKKFTADELAAM